MEKLFDTRKKKMIITAICILLLVATAIIIVFAVRGEISTKPLQTSTGHVQRTSKTVQTEGLSQWNVILK